jgi:glyceraldehyde-3-phosphate dehydrogenase (NADP+)
MMLYARFLLELSSSKDNDYNNEILQALLNSDRSNFITTDYIL